MEKTIVMFTTDHGVALPFNKCNLTDSGIGVSLIMRVPGAKANGQVIDALVSHVDVMPTLCDLLQMEKPDYLEGTSFAEVFEDISAEPVSIPAMNRSAAYAHAGINISATMTKAGRN